MQITITLQEENERKFFDMKCLSNKTKIIYDKCTFMNTFQNLISVPTLIRAYLREKWSEINTHTYTIIRNCRVASLVFEFFKKEEI